MNLFKILGTIAINNSDANSSIDETSEKAEGFSSKLKSGIGTAAKWGAAVVGGAAAAGTALVGFASKSAATADHVDKMSQKIGISRQAYQELDFICSQSGTSVDNLQAGMKSLTSAMDGAKSGTAANVEQFQKLGVSVTNADGSFRSQEEVLFDTIAALQGMDNQTEKARLATELFGRSGTELMPLLNGASGSIEEMRKQAHDLGLVLDDELIDNGVNLTDSLDQTKRAFARIGTQLGGSLMPIVEQASDYIQQSLPAIQSLIGRLSPIITRVLSSILPLLMRLAATIFPILFDMIEQLIPPITQIVEAILPVIVQLIEMLLPPIVQIAQAVLPILVQLITALLPLLQPILQLLQPLIDLLLALLEPLIELLNMILPPLIEVITEVVQEIVGVLQPTFEEIAKVIESVLNVAFKEISTVVQSVVSFITENWKGAQKTLTAIFNAIKAVITTVWNGIKTVTVTIFNAVKTTVSSIWNGIKNTVTSVINAIKSTISSGLNGAKSVVSNVLESIRSKFSSIFESAKDIVKNAIETIKGFFNFSWSLPKLKLPHFSIAGEFSLNPPSVPHFNIDWYAKAMEDGIVMNRPTIFGYNPRTNQLMGGGEAGSETVVGTDNLMSMIQTAVNKRDGDVRFLLSAILAIMQKIDKNLYDTIVRALSEMQFTINGREFARLVRKV